MLVKFTYKFIAINYDKYNLTLRGRGGWQNKIVGQKQQQNL